MILKLYKSNTSIGVLLLPFFSILISIPILFNDFETKIYFYSWQTEFFNWVNEHTIINFTLCTSLLILNSVLINQVFNKTNFFSKSTFIPALIYVVLVSFDSGIVFDSVLIIHLILLILVSQLMRIDQNNSFLNIAFTSGLLVGILAVFSIHYFIISLSIIVAFFTIKSFNWREWLLVFVGAFIPLLYLFSAQFIFANGIEVGSVKGVYVPNSQVQLVNYIQLGCFVSVLLVSIKSLLRFYSHNTSITKKRLFSIFILLVTTVAMFVVGFVLFGQSDFIFIVPLALLLSISSINSNSDGLMSLLLTIILIVNIVSGFIE